MSTDYSQLKAGDRFRAGTETFGVLFSRNSFMPVFIAETLVIINEESHKIEIISFDDPSNFISYELLADRLDERKLLYESTSVRTSQWLQAAQAKREEIYKAERIKQMKEDLIGSLTDEQREFFDVVEKAVETE